MYSDPEDIGILHIIYGCMFSGKTTRLKYLLNAYTVQKGYKTIFYSHDNTDRNRGNRKTTGQPMDIIYINELNKYTVIDDSIKVIGVDEAQFFNENIIEFVIKYLQLNKIIIISGLNGTFEAKTFGHVHSLFPYATKTDILTADCDICKAKGTTNYPASFTARISNEKDLVVIGDDKYMPMCALHYYQHINK